MIPALCLAALVTGTALAAETVSVTLVLTDGTEIVREAPLPADAALYYAAFDTGGRYLSGGVVSGDTVELAEGTDTVKLFPLDGDLRPLTAAVRARPGAWSGDYADLYREGLACLDAKDYAAAIDALTAAIRRDSTQPPAYVARGDAYIGAGETAANLDAAQADYETAAGLDAGNADAYLGIADVHIRRGEYDEAEAVLKDARDKAADPSGIDAKLKELADGNVKDSAGQTRKRSTYDADGNLIWWHEYTYDGQGRKSSTTSFDADGNQTGHVDNEYDANGNTLVGSGYENPTGILIRFEDKYDDNGNAIESAGFYMDGTMFVQTLYQYNEQGQPSRDDYYYYDKSGTLVSSYYWVYEYDDAGREIKNTEYEQDGTPTGYQTMAYDEMGHRTEYCGYWYRDGTAILSWRYVYEYNETGKRIRETEYDGDGNVKSFTTYD